MNEREELARELFIGDNFNQSREASIEDWEWLAIRRGIVAGTVAGQRYFDMADAVLAAGYRKVTT